MKLLGIDTNSKTVKGQKFGYLTGILYLAPAKESDVMNTCPHSSPGCRVACLFTAGRGRFSSVKKSRIEKTILLKTDRHRFMQLLYKDIDQLEKKAAKLGLTPCVRLNGTSDIPWENMDIMDKYPHIQFYDYTKNFDRMMRYLENRFPKNYHLTFSKDEDNILDCFSVLACGGNVAVVFRDLPQEWNGFEVVNADESDLRFLDKKNVVCGLHAKGAAKKDTSGFVV